MTDSGAAHRITASDILARAARARSRVDWSRLAVGAKGFLLTLATAIAFDQLARHGMPVVHPFAFLLLTVVYSTYSGGLRSGIASAVVSLLYARHYLAEPGFILRYTPENA
jgi:K+-sensing histidine kinase KdpD